jgi:anaerobic selenocysteine-containing dehydrogenase
MQYTPPIVTPPPGVMQGFEVFWGLSKRLGIDMNIPGVSLDHKPTADEMLDGLYSGSRIPMDEIRKYPGGHVWGDLEQKVGYILPDMIGHPDRRMALAHPEVLTELKEVLSEPVIETGGFEENENFAFRMITYRMKEVYCTQGQNLPNLHKRAPYNPVMMNPDDAKNLGVADGDTVAVENDFGSLEGIVKTSDTYNRGVIGIAHGWGDPADKRGINEKGCNVQRIIPDDVRYDRITGLALMSAVPVNVAPLK